MINKKNQSCFTTSQIQDNLGPSYAILFNYFLLPQVSS
jgi:hypothetical protein